MAVSSTSVKGFSYTKAILGVDAPNQLLFILKSSSQFTIGDAVRLNTSGLLVRCANTDPAVLGIVQGFYDQTGNLGVFSPRISGAAIAGATLTPDDTITTASDNSSNGLKKLSAYVIPNIAGEVLYRNVANGSLTQVNVGAFFNVVSSNAGQIDQASASFTNGQFQLVSLDPDGDSDATKGLFRIAQGQLVSNFVSYGSNAVITA
ncbi:MAG: hypothetical protein ACRDFB_09185 [Rhabdochlamydiaceae bacterium]